MTVLTVRRTGGFAGRTETGLLDLAGDDPRAARAAALLAGVDLRTARAGRPHPDMYTYVFEVSGADPGQGTGQGTGRGTDEDVVTAAVPEHLLTPELRALADLVLSLDR